MSDTRPHLSIGEVLSLLQDEFPDITISKIRFLESQGLLNPERTPSGYRKFYDHDVEQLRWVLRQQKDNFLPLKVIKDRLAAGQLDGSASESGVLDLAPPPSVSGRPAAADTATATSADAPPGESARPDGMAPPRSTPSPAASPPGQAPAPSPAAAVPADGQAQAGGRALADGQAHAGSRAPADPARSTAARAPAPPPSPARPSARGDVGGGGQAASPREARSTERPRAETGLGSSASLTADELCAATGVTPRLLAELERFGLVDGRALGPDTVYDDEAMVVCRLALTLSDAGIEARHLRMFKVSAEREAGLYEQLALPRLRAQRPEARQEAVAQVAALSGTAAELHAALLRRALRGTLGPL